MEAAYNFSCTIIVNWNDTVIVWFGRRLDAVELRALARPGLQMAAWQASGPRSSHRDFPGHGLLDTLQHLVCRILSGEWRTAVAA